MSSTEDPKLPRDVARRHFLGVTAAAGARIAGLAALAAAISSSPASAMGHRWGRGGSGGHGGWWGGHGGTHGSRPDGASGSGGANCFLRGTAILTDCGEKPVEDLRIGDCVALPDGSVRSIRWVGRQTFKKSSARWLEGVVPVRISRHALDSRTPHSDLYLSPDHALLLNGVLIRVKHLVNGTTIAPVIPADDAPLEYYAVLLDTHEAILAEGAAAESFRLLDNSDEAFSNFAEYKRLYGEKPTAMTSYAPVLGEEGGWKHLKALLLLAVSPLVPMRDPLGDACEKINAQAKELSF